MAELLPIRKLGFLLPVLLAANASWCGDIASVRTIEVVQGDRQIGYLSGRLRTLIVRAVGAEGDGVADVPVTFSIASGDGFLSRTKAQTDANGFASVIPTLPNEAGAMRIRVEVPGSAGMPNFDGTTKTVQIIASAAAVPADPTSRAHPASYNADWAEATHQAKIPNYLIVFAPERVNTLEISMSAQQWQRMSAEVSSILGTNFGVLANQNPGGPGGPGGPGAANPLLQLSQEDAAYLPVTVRYNGKIWKQVGFRLKGNSSLNQSWGAGNLKLPFRLNFDHFESLFDPALRNQNLYGFSELSFSPGFSDATLLREKLASELLEHAGVPVAKTSFVRVFTDIGQGMQFRGIYTQVEVVEDTALQRLFGTDTGNLYKPDSALTRFDTQSVGKKNNAGARADYSDIAEFIKILNSSERLSNPASWRLALERRFNVDAYLQWLAVNVGMVNWDSYGRLAHNYFLYTTSDKRLNWIPWDHDLAFGNNPGITPEASNPNPLMLQSGLSLSLAEIDGNWPLIRYLIDDPIYAARYRGHLKQFAASTLQAEQINPIIERNYALIAPYALGVGGELAGAPAAVLASFTAGPQTLKNHFAQRRALIEQFAP